MIKHTIPDPDDPNHGMTINRDDLRELKSRYLEVPHECDNPECPGNKTRRKLANHDWLVAEMEKPENKYDEVNYRRIFKLLYIFLTEAEKIEEADNGEK